MTNKKTITGLKINSFSRSMEYVEIDKTKGLIDYYKAISSPAKEVNIIEKVDLDINGYFCEKSNRFTNELWIDEDGLFVNPIQQRFFIFEGRFYAGNGVILMADCYSGESLSTMLTFRDIALSGALAFPT